MRTHELTAAIRKLAPDFTIVEDEGILGVTCTVGGKRYELSHSIQGREHDQVMRELLEASYESLRRLTAS